ncbi:nucleotidyltransferase family protein [uncultured Clostridium sp.]|jgi:dTDP-glucose pyrophosphorylase/predicted transcriptional regulator|uniref:nucleotidyltransferase family protein n=1 Tax=uncultured Clostridium sp. TaxID=59620 RepID=UPI002597C99A|nr:nucleotidyltransferase family protein [uncultured Clostridium sp.]
MNIKDLIIYSDVTIREAMLRLDDVSKGIVFVVNNEEKLQGTITDGDIRRWILKNGSMDEKVTSVMNNNPIYVMDSDDIDIMDIMVKKSISAIPVINEYKNIVNVKFLTDKLYKKGNESLDLKEVPVVIMAGGLGSRLYPYTKILPKPLIPIGDTPIVERIINKFNEYGADNFYLTVNYKKNMIKSYFGELAKNYEIDYVEEDKPLGTGGSLYLLKGKINNTFFVSNCDILIDADYSKILDHHKKSGNKVTVVASVKNFTIPYGVFKLNENGNIQEIQEKPQYTYLINTGMYVIEPEVLEDIPENEFYNLPDIVERYMETGIPVGVFPISEQSWMDMGQINEMQSMIEKIEKMENNK